MLSKSHHAKQIFRAGQARGDRLISSDATFVIEGLESYRDMITNFPMPVATIGDPAEIVLEGGFKKWQTTQGIINQQGGITLAENVIGDGALLMSIIHEMGGTFRAKIYEGNPENYYRYHQLEECMIKFDEGERAFEDTTTPQVHSGTLHYHYFDEIVIGNVGGSSIKSVFNENI